MIDGEQRPALAAARDELGDFVDADGTVAFPAPARIATATAPPGPGGSRNG